MTKRRIEIPDEYGVIDTGNHRTYTGAEDESFFADLYDQPEGCTECEYEGPLELRRRGWRCPDCREIIIPTA